MTPEQLKHLKDDIVMGLGEFDPTEVQAALDRIVSLETELKDHRDANAEMSLLLSRVCVDCVFWYGDVDSHYHFGICDRTDKVEKWDFHCAAWEDRKYE